MSQPQTNSHSDVQTARLAVMREINYVQKLGQMRGGQSYSYLAVEDLVAALRPAMVANGLAITLQKVEVAITETYKTARDATMNRIALLATWSLDHATSGTSIVTQVMGEGADVGDKACNKAMTAALKYALRLLFCIETGDDDPDRHASELQARRTKARKAQPQSQPTQRRATQPQPADDRDDRRARDREELRQWAERAASGEASTDEVDAEPAEGPNPRFLRAIGAINAATDQAQLDRLVAHANKLHLDEGVFTAAELGNIQLAASIRAKSIRATAPPEE